MLEFTTTDGLVIFLAVDCIESIVQATGKSVTITMSSGNRYDVNETIVAVLGKIE